MWMQPSELCFRTTKLESTGIHLFKIPLKTSPGRKEKEVHIL